MTTTTTTVTTTTTTTTTVTDDVAVDAAGNVYVADQANHRIRKITPARAVTTIAGSTSGSADGVGANGTFAIPGDVAVDARRYRIGRDWPVLRALPGARMTDDHVRALRDAGAALISAGSPTRVRTGRFYSPSDAGLAQL